MTTTSGVLPPAFSKPTGMPTSSTGVWVEWINITPAVAKEWLDNFNPLNRPLSKIVAGVYAEDMTEDRWEITSQGIGFDSNMELVDGQHRLQAIVMSGVSEEFPVFFGLVPTKARTATDIGKGRRVGDELHMREIPNSSLAASTATLILKYRRGTVGLSKEDRLTKTEVVQWVVANQDSLRPSLAIGQRVRQNIKVSVACLSAAHFILAEIDQAQADFLFTGLYTGESISGTHVTLRNRLMNDAQITEGRKLNTPQLLWIILRAWNAMRKRQELKKMQLPVAPITGPNMIKAV